MAVTIKDIARALGVTHATVSKALNGHPSVSEETRSRVLKLAREMNYQPNLVARRLSRRRSHTVGVAWHGLGATWLSYLAGEIHRAFVTRGYEVLFSLDRPDRAASLFAQQMLDWVIIGATPRQSERHRLLEWYKTANIPLVSVGFVLDDDVPSVDADRAASIAMGVKHLYQAGRRRIALVSYQPGKIAGYERAMAELGLGIGAYLQKARYEDSLKALDNLLGLAEPPDAVIGGDSRVATRILHELRVRGYDVPGQVAVVGYDELPGCDEVEVPLTTVGPSASAMAEAVADLLLDYARHKTPPHIQIPPSLVVRRSCGAAGEAPGKTGSSA